MGRRGALSKRNAAPASGIGLRCAWGDGRHDADGRGGGAVWKEVSDHRCGPASGGAVSPTPGGVAVGTGDTGTAAPAGVVVRWKIYRDAAGRLAAAIRPAVVATAGRGLGSGGRVVGADNAGGVVCRATALPGADIDA